MGMHQTQLLKFKKLIEFKWFPAYFFLHIALDYLRTQKTLKSFNRIYPFKTLKDFPVSRYKTSDTLFILGSGSSISTYSNDEWQIIGQHDSIGFNFWPVHDFVPTYYQVEIPQDRLERAKLLATLLNVKEKDYRNTPIILKTSHATIPRQQSFFGELSPHFLKGIYLSRMLPIPGLTVETKRKSVAWLKSLGYFQPGKWRTTVTGWASSVTDILHIAFSFGYKNIVLCGVDLNDSRYFYEVDAQYYAAKGVPIPWNIYDGKSKHSVNVGVSLLPGHPEWGKVKLKDTLDVLNDILLKPKGINLYVALKSSALYPEIPDYFTNSRVTSE